MYSYIKRYLRKCGARYVITAVNHFLGFDGSSIKASGFEYLADRNVDYSYTNDLSYIGPLNKKPNIKYYMDNSSFKNKLYYCKL